ncbi:peptidyl-prolyl cis-trans isomerase [Pseudomonas mandelii]|uniref:peptidylprolyl isomerase n=1 Tax=Pseudomonas mandelii TaxID=75612 RepID=UPI001C82D51C|nr:peptidylprolyl isomerase [Pseudomonas mandelii]QZA98489.1 peptidyl-prolyl cis-trans isomerase [Pseudomonas mandelii]
MIGARRWLREPLLHFLIVGLALFGVYRELHPRPDQAERSNRIELTADDLRQIDVAWRASWQRSPTPAEMRGLVKSQIREEVLFQEAVALGLDKGDTIVKRRLAQKMEFLTEDASTIRDPSAAELKSWFDKNRDRFAQPGRISFHHLYFSPDRRGGKVQQAAAKALAALAGKGADAPGAASLADRFMERDYYAEREPAQVANVFGAQFAQALSQVKPGSWQGPIESGLGWHLVFVDAIAPGRIPAFDEVEAAVKAEWMDDQRADSKRRAFDAMLAHYEIVLPAEVR